MKAQTQRENGELIVTVSGEINTVTTPQLALPVEDLTGIKRLVFDLSQVRYVSSAGLRLFLNCQRLMAAAHGEMLIKGCNEFVMETFESVGYDRIMKLERESGTNG